MKPMFAKLLVILSVVVLAGGPAWAERDRHKYRGHGHGHVHWGIQIGTPWVYPPYRPPYWPHVHVPAPVIVTPPPQTIYIERSPPAVSSVPVLEPGFWYYCQESGAYYPHVKQCAGNWHKVSPQPGQ